MCVSLRTWEIIDSILLKVDLQFMMISSSVSSALSECGEALSLTQFPTCFNVIEESETFVATSWTSRAASRISEASWRKDIAIWRPAPATPTMDATRPISAILPIDSPRYDLEMNTQASNSLRVAFRLCLSSLELSQAGSLEKLLEVYLETITSQNIAAELLRAGSSQ